MRIFNSPRLPSILLLLCILLQGSIALIFALTLRYEIKSSGMDGAVNAQLMDNLIHGKGLTTSINFPFIPQPWLGFHFSPIFYVLAPIYFLFPYIETFLVIGSYAVALAAWPIFLTARTILKNSWQALAMALLYLISPYVLNATIWDFRDVYFAPLCIATMLWALLHKKRNTLLVLCVVLLCIKEHYGLAVAGFGLLWAWHWRGKPFGFGAFGLGLSAFGILALYLVIGITMPHFNPHHAPAMMESLSPTDRFSWLQHPFHKGELMARIAILGLRYMVLLLLPFLFSPLMAIPWLLPGLADMSANILSTESMMRSPYSYHSMALIPVIIIASCVGIKKYCSNSGVRITQTQALWAIVLMSSCCSYVSLALPMPGAGNIIWQFSSPRLRYTDADAQAINAINAIIPADATVAAQINALPHITPHYEMYPLPHYFENTDYIVLYLRYPFQHVPEIFQVPYGVDPDDYFKVVDRLLANPEWKIEFYANRWVLFKKHGVDKPEARQATVDALIEARQEYKNARESKK